MRNLTLLAAAASLAALGACSPKVEIRQHDHPRRMGQHEPLRAISRLDCPDRQGELTRLSAAADGQACVYGGQNAEVTLRLVALNGGDAEAALAPIEADLKALMPTMKTPPSPPPAPGGKPGKPRGESARINLPGIHIDAHDKGADIKIGGLTINANDGSAEVRVSKNVTLRDGEKAVSERAGGGNSNVSVKASDDDEGDIDIHANDDGAQIRQRKRGDGVRATLILASDKATSGYRVVGYEARGPKGGPLAVAVVKARDRDGSDHDVFEDMKTLVRRNVGG